MDSTFETISTGFTKIKVNTSDVTVNYRAMLIRAGKKM